MAKNSKRKKSTRQKTNYANYQDFGMEQKNRLKKLARHVKKFPFDYVALNKLSEFKSEGSPHRRNNRTVGIKLTERMQEILKHKGKRLSSYKVQLLGLLNNPAKRRPSFSMNLDVLHNITIRRTRVKYMTVMRIAMEKAQNAFDKK